MMKSIFYKTLYLVALVMLISSAYLCNVHDNRRAGSSKYEPLPYLPSGKLLKGLVLGYDEALADFVWIRTVTWFGVRGRDYRDDPWLPYLINLATELDPRFLAPYEFGGLILAPEAGKPDEAIALLKRGIENVPRNTPRYWLQPFYLGYNYMIYKNDPIKAAESLEFAASFPESPKYLPLLIARLYADADDPDLGLAFINELLKNSDNTQLREALEKRAAELIITRHILFLERAVALFIQKNHRTPQNLNELVSEKVIESIPKEPLGGTYSISETGEVLSSTIGGKLKIYAPKS